MKALCPHCGHPAAAADIDIHAMRARCASCGTSFPLAPALGAPAPAPAPAPPRIPRRFRIDADAPRGFTVSWRWWRWEYLFLCVWCAGWDTGISFWLINVVFNPRQHHDLMSLLFPIPHFLVGVFVTWFLACALANRTTVTCDGDTLVVRHGPLWWPGARDVPLRDLRDLRLGQGYRAGKGNSGRQTYTLLATRDRKELTLLSGLDGDQADWLLANLRARLPQSS
jgi:hypothetical protein